jgi:hypothetical protein
MRFSFTTAAALQQQQQLLTDLMLESIQRCKFRLIEI